MSRRGGRVAPAPIVGVPTPKFSSIAAPVAADGEVVYLVIYDGYPDRRTPFVARWWTCIPGARPRPGLLILRPTLAAARAVAPASFRRLPRQKADHRRILETWVPRAEPAA